jgi:hypothetical protein
MWAKLKILTNSYHLNQPTCPIVFRHNGLLLEPVKDIGLKTHDLRPNKNSLMSYYLKSYVLV